MAELCPVFFGFWVECGSLCFIKADITNMYYASIKNFKGSEMK